MVLGFSCSLSFFPEAWDERGVFCLFVLVLAEHETRLYPFQYSCLQHYRSIKYDTEMLTLVFFSRYFILRLVCKGWSMEIYLSLY